MSSRGGAQRIPRPPLTRRGHPAPWARLSPDERRVTLDDLRRLCAELPPPRRPVSLAPGVRPAAVLVPFFDRDGEAVLVLTKRPETMPSHRGEIAFPGGKLQPDVDGALSDTALREAHEEIGLRPADVEVVGELDSYLTFSSRFAVSPFVGLLAAPPEHRPDPREVVRVFEVTVSELLADGVHREERWGLGPLDRPVHFFELEGETVWGVTAAILTRFLSRLAEGG